ncbi:DUF262 domain-containing protein [Dyella japonica]|uniref:DUF262 domain-containing protein n=1 Tax=Dyella japonica A8 TaxID=1217721 RepID=A0A075K564_9GAMM|nr:DUF262 domain-containing protein [Dyella japonica]AIF47318.1 hypothetical protein HY57_08550 [Dyella japonica A8]
MEANARNLEKIFESAVQYQCPLFQRPYVWTEEKGWQELWEDIEDLLYKQLTRGSVHPHFMGAAVLEQLSTSTGTIETRQVIDGQQRFTTLQVVMIAARDLATHLGSDRYRDSFGDLVSNRPNRIDKEEQLYKLWPTNADRPAYSAVHGCGSIAELDKRVAHDPILAGSNIVGAYRYFSQQLSEWINSEFLDDDGHPLHRQPDTTDRMEGLWHVLRSSLQLVVIDLNRGDEAQVIFETMNALGEPLLPGDLIKNYLFRLAMAEKADVDKLYPQYWAAFDAKDWREEVKQGRITRPLIDVFLNYYLALMTQDDVKSTHLFSAFKAFAKDDQRRSYSLIDNPKTAAEHMATLARYGKIFRTFYQPTSHPRLITFLDRLEAVDTTTVYPFLLLAYDALMPTKQDEFDKILVIIESFLIRRMVCKMTTKNYNRLFIDLIKYVAKSGVITAKTVSVWLARSNADSQRFPGDEELAKVVITRPLYNDLAQYKVKAVLEALDMQLEHSKSEALPLPPGLTIEHVLPQLWEKHWPLPDDVAIDPGKVPAARSERWCLLHSLGNLTLITGSLNPSLSNGPWVEKRPELQKYSKLNLNRYFHDDAVAKTWDEHAIIKRGHFLLDAMKKVWPDVARATEVEAEQV